MPPFQGGPQPVGVLPVFLRQGPVHLSEAGIGGKLGSIHQHNRPLLFPPKPFPKGQGPGLGEGRSAGNRGYILPP